MFGLCFTAVIRYEVEVYFTIDINIRGSLLAQEEEREPCNHCIFRTNADDIGILLTSSHSRKRSIYPARSRHPSMFDQGVRVKGGIYWFSNI